MNDYLDLPDDYDEDIARRRRPRLKPDRRLKRSHSQMKADLTEQGEFGRTDARRKPKKSDTEVYLELAEEVGARRGFTPSFGSMSSAKNHLSNHEREWITVYLGAFYDDHLITDVLRRVKGGKEATVYCCLADSATGVDLVAGKVYHPRMFRNLKNDSLYRQGRTVLDDQGKGVRGRREVLAMQKKTGFGQELRHLSWLASEYNTLSRLHEAGADVPRPIASNDNAILMEYLGDEKWAAPPLSSVRLRPAEARTVFDCLMRNVELMLSQEIVHGDLSAFNVLYWEGKASMIDFPQAVNPFINPDAYSLFARDVERLCQYFTRYGIATDPAALARDIWNRCIPG